MARIVDFADGAQSETTPTIGNIEASSLIRYPDDATYEATELNAPETGDLYYNTTDNTIRYYNGSIWQELVDESTIQALENKAIDADNNTITNIDNNEIKPLAGIEATKIADGSVDDTEFQSLDGVTGPIQPQLDDLESNKQDISEKDQPNGYPGLDANGRISESALPVTALIYRGTWDASTNTPSLADGVGTQGDVYRTSVAGTQDLGSGPINFAVGDWVTYNGSVWQRSDFEGAGVLNDLQDVDTTGVTDGQALVYNQSAGEWQPGAIQNVIQENIAFIGNGSAAWTAPGGVQDENIAEVLGNDADLNIPSGTQKGFTFTPTKDGDIKRIFLTVTNRGTMSGDGTVSVSIYETSAGLPTGSPIYNSTTNLSTASAFPTLKAVELRLWNFSPGQPLVAGTKYAAMITHDDSGTVVIRRSAVNEVDTENITGAFGGPPNFALDATQESIYHEVEATTNVPGQLVLSDNSFISVPPLANDRHQIDAQTIEILNDQVAYINLDRSAASPTSRTVIVDDATNVTPDNNKLIFARAINDECYVGLHDLIKIVDAETVDLQRPPQPTSGDGSKNYFESIDANLETSVGNWLTDNGAGSPSPGLTLSYTTTVGEVLAGVGSLKLEKDAANRSGHFIKVLSKTIDLADRGRANYGSLEFKSISGYVNSDLILEVYDVTNAAVLYSGIAEDLELVSGLGRFSWVSYLEDNTEQVEFRVKVNNANTNAFSVVFDEFKFGPAAQLVSPIITEWQEFTPTGTWTTNTTYTGRWRRVGDSAEYFIQANLSGAPDALQLSVNLLPGHVIDASKLTSTEYEVLLGTAGIRDDNVNTGFQGNVFYLGSNTSVNVGFNNTLFIPNQVIYQFVTNTTPITFAAGDAVCASFKVPIQGWGTGSVLSTNELSQQTIHMSARSDGTQVVPTNVSTTVSHTLDILDPFGTWDGSFFTAPKAGWYSVNASSSSVYIPPGPSEFRLFILKNNGPIVAQNGVYTTPGIAATWSGSVSANVFLEKGETLSASVIQNSSISVTLTNLCTIQISSMPDFTTLGVVKNNEVIEVAADPFLSQNLVAGVRQDITSFVLPAGTWILNGSVSHSTFLTPASAFDFFCGLGETPGDVPFGSYIEGTLAYNVVAAIQYLSFKSVFNAKLVATEPTTIYLKQLSTISTTAMRLDHYRLQFERQK